IATGYTVSSDRTRYVFEIDRGRLFHDGSPLTSEDVAYSLQLSASADSTYGLLRRLIDCREIGNPASCPIHALDQTRVEVRLKEPVEDLLERLNYNENAIRRKSAAQAEPVYSGLYEPQMRDFAFLRLVSNKRHPLYSPTMFENIQLRPFNADADGILTSVSDVPRVVLSKALPSVMTGDKINQNMKIYRFNAGYTYLASFRADLAHIDYVKWAFQKSVSESGIFSAFPLLEPTHSFFPRGFAHYEEVNLVEPSRPGTDI